MPKQPQRHRNRASFHSHSKPNPNSMPFQAQPHVIPSVAEESRQFSIDSLQEPRFLGYARNDMAASNRPQKPLDIRPPGW